MPVSPQPAWKRWLALLSLLLSGLLWLSGLLDSLERPTVGGTLERRQLELAVLAEPALPSALRPALSGDQPRQALQRLLASQVIEAETPAPAEQQLQLALLDRQLGEPERARSQLISLDSQVQPEQRALIGALLAGRPLPPMEREALQGPWQLNGLVEQLLCEQLTSQPHGCTESGRQQGAVWRLLGANGLPALLVLAGLGLLARAGWQRWRRGPAVLPSLQAPALGLVDVSLLVAGGFVLVGELLTPLLAAPLVQGLATTLTPDPDLRQGLAVLGLYLALMAGPLLILRLQLGSCSPEQRSLQWQWRPVGASLGWAVSRMVMILPVVALVGWLVQQLVGNGGGSNPLLDLVLTSHSRLALACFAFTALVLAPLFEETLFRGVLLPVLAQNWGRGWGLLLSALSFGIAHLSLAELPALVTLGLGLGWLRLRSGRLGACVLMHGLWNALTFVNLLMLSG